MGLRSMQRHTHSANEMIWYDEQRLSEPVECLFDLNYWQQQNAIVGSAQGRGTTWFIATAQGEAALRHYRRGGLFSKLVKDQYWFSGWENTRSYQEFQLLAHLKQCGVNVPAPLAARAVKCGLFYRADLLSEKIAQSQDLVSLLQHNALTQADYQRIGQQIRAMHQAQVNHSDLNIHNILLDEQQRVWIIDFDKCTQQTGDHWKDSNLARLRRSFEKEQKKRAIHWQASDFEALLLGYQHS